MAEEQEASNEIDEGGDAEEPESPDYDLPPITTTTIENVVNPEKEDYDVDDEDLPDVVVKLYVNDQSDGVSISPDLVNAALTDIYGNPIPSTTTSLIDSVNDYTATITQEVFDELSGNSTAIAGGKGWLGWWSWHKALFVGLITLCIIGILLALLFLVIGKKFKKNKRSPTPGTTTATKAVVTKNVTTEPKYQSVPNV